MDAKQLLTQALQTAQSYLASEYHISLSLKVKTWSDEIIVRSESSKAVLTVILTSLTYKLLFPTQDIRRHQSSIQNGYSGRTFDTQYITFFLKEQCFPSMAESGWLTRSLEQKLPYDKNYTGAIRPEKLKQTFLNLIDHIEHSTIEERENLLLYLLTELLRLRERNSISLACPQNLSIKQILIILEKHFSATYQFDGASRLPTLALYAVYQILMDEIKRFHGCLLLPLESHTSADKQSGRMGDIDVVDKQNLAFEAVEIKHQIEINLEHLETAYKKFMGTPIKRYYILSTIGMSTQHKELLEQRINDIKNTHGCQLIVNGVYESLHYYLRLLENPTLFITGYTHLLSKDSAIKYEHKVQWNNIVTELLRRP